MGCGERRKVQCTTYWGGGYGNKVLGMRWRVWLEGVRRYGIWCTGYVVKVLVKVYSTCYMYIPRVWLLTICPMERGLIELVVSQVRSHDNDEPIKSR